MCQLSNTVPGRKYLAKIVTGVTVCVEQKLAVKPDQLQLQNNTTISIN